MWASKVKLEDHSVDWRARQEKAQSLLREAKRRVREDADCMEIDEGIRLAFEAEELFAKNGEAGWQVAALHVTARGLESTGRAIEKP